MQPEIYAPARSAITAVSDSAQIRHSNSWMDVAINIGIARTSTAVAAGADRTRKTLVEDSRDLGPGESAAAGSLGEESGAVAKTHISVSFDCPQPHDEAQVAASSSTQIPEFRMDNDDLSEPNCDDDDGSVSGDTAGTRTDAEIEGGDLSAVAARRTEMAQPTKRVVGDLHPYNEPAERNKRKDVGNFGLFMGNWGQRSEKKAASCAQRDLHDSNVMGSPGMIIVLFEATTAVAAMLEREPSHVPDRPPPRHNEKAPLGNMSARAWFEHLVCMGEESKGAILMAVRKNVCENIECVYSDSWVDGIWNVKGKNNTATTRVMVCKFTWKQNIGHLGKDVTVMGVHGHYRTMNMLFNKTVNDELWKKIKDLIVEHNVNLLVGDWNMSLPQVVPRLTALGLHVDLCSWYPWLHDTDHAGGNYFGMDSCAMFHIGGDVLCEMTWDFDKIGEIITEAARDPAERPRSRHGDHSLDRYSGNNFPGQLWDTYKSKSNGNESVDLQTKLESLLRPSTTMERLGELHADLIEQNKWRHKRDKQSTAFLRLKQKAT